MVSFTRKAIGEIVNPEGQGAMNLLCVLGDLNKDGRLDIVISPRNGQMVWFENKGEDQEWERHLINDIEHNEAGGVLYDLTGNGYLDLIVGGDWQGNTIKWWENPGEKGGRWTERVIYQTDATQFHDQVIGDITNDGTMSLVFWNQGGQTLYWVPLPEDPMVSPWPNVRKIITGISAEGLAIADIDGDGKNELVSGNRWYKYTGTAGQEWEVHQFAGDYVSTRAAVGDLDGDGQLEIVLAEGDAHLFGKPMGGKLAWFKPGADIRDMWEEHIIDEGLQDPHSLEVGDLCGNGRLDIFAGEIGIPGNDKKARIMVYENDGKANFVRHIVDEEVSTHEARLGDMGNRGALDIVGKPLYDPEKWKIHIWYNQR